MKTSLFILLCCIILFSCTAAFKSTIKEGGKQLPPDLGKDNSAMVVIRYGKRGHDKYLVKNFKKYYKGEYAIVDNAYVAPYNDVNKYRYIFAAEQHYNPGQGSGRDRMPPTYSYSYHIIDRKTGERYDTEIDSGLFSKLMKAYLSKLESLRAKNAKG